MASSALFYFYNLTEDGSLTATSEADGYPVENLQDRDKASYWKPNTTATQQITLTLSAADSARAIVIVHDNLYTKNIGIKVLAADNAAFTSGVVWLVGNASTIHPPTADDEPYWYERFPVAPTKQYWRVEFHHLGTPNTDALVADIYLSSELDTERHPGGEWEEDYEDTTRLHMGRGFRSAVSTVPPSLIKRLNFLAIEKTLNDAIDAGYMKVRAGFLPFFYFDEYGVMHHVRMTGKPASKHKGKLWDKTVELIKEI